MAVWHALLLAAGAGILAPMAVWSIECAAALLPARRTMAGTGARRPRVAVLVPAHNEAAGIGQTLESLAPQVHAEDRVVVIADNCTDATAAIARRAGAVVVERHDDVRRGKSYAIDCGVRALQADPPEVFVVIDADCTVYPEAVNSMARLAFATGRPVQGNYVLELPAGPKSHHDIAALAFLIKNVVRPGGLDRLGLPCFLNGSGMAFPAAVMQDALLASGRIAEDKWLTVDLALSGHVPAFCREARITGRLPAQRKAETSQRTRWLHGHLECILFQGPRLLLAAIRQRRMDLLALACDLFVPPLSLLLILWLAILLAATTAGLLGAGWKPAILPAAGGALMALSFAAVVSKFGRAGVLASLLAGPAYVVSGLPIHLAFLFRREKDWVRTERDSETPPE